MTQERDPDPIAVGAPEDAELADEELDRPRTKRPDVPDDEKADEEREPLEGGAETMADLDEEAGQANRPGTERPPA
jgi:hypothetical protein